jgi:hypothetical protein
VTCSTGPEAQLRVPHRLAEVRADLLHVRAHDEVEDQAEQHLEVERGHRKESPPVGQRIVALHFAAHRRKRGADDGDEGNPANPGMKQQAESYT